MNLNKRLIAPALAGLLTLPALANAAPGDIYRGTVVAVIDANTLRVARQGGGEIRVRLPDAPGVEALRNELQGHAIEVREDHWENGLIHADLVPSTRL